MTDQERNEITIIAKEFASAFKDTIGEISGSGWLIVDPLSGYLDFAGFKHELAQIPANDQHPQILFMTFDDGWQFIPAGSDLPHPDAKDWIWVQKVK